MFFGDSFMTRAILSDLACIGIGGMYMIVLRIDTFE